jgi:hypothetical protein
MLCKNCEQKLLKIDGNSAYYAYECDNVYCYLFAHPQHYGPKNPEALPQAARYRNVYSSTYEDYKAQKRENYELLRNLGIEPKQANLMSSSKKQTQLALENGVPK